MRKLLLFLSIFFYACPLAWAENHAYLAPYNALLGRYVSDGEKHGMHSALVDYKGWSEDARHAEAMRLIAQVNPDALSGKEAMAFWINAYNLLTIDLIIQQNEHESIKHIGGWLTNPWKDYHWMIGGRRYSLDEIEHGILRKKGDPRIHMAINCASLSCPDLRAEGYTAETLDTQLDDQVRRFLRNDKKGLHITNSGLEVSKIFDWFAGDFTEKGGVVTFIKSYVPQMPQDAVIADYFNYNWQLNGAWE
ncbi:MAG: DUF547 domain-containing protein [Pseudomonadota bacterium]|nr:DUF547 domain-containing protein [Pseudomonadota bacterium]